MATSHSHGRPSRTADAIIWTLQRATRSRNAPASSFTRTREIMANGSLRIGNVAYDNEYPNGTMDIYIADGDPSTIRPTYVYVHGGGWSLGDKRSGDPAVRGDAGFRIICDPLLTAGYNFVSIDYALAPQVRYPVPLIQLSRAISFLQERGTEFGVDMRQVVLAGGSAGGQLAGQLANIETNPVYAASVGLAPVTTGNLAAVVFDSALLDTSRVARTQARSLLANALFGLAARSYFIADPQSLSDADITAHLSQGFPPTFAADGNTGTFPDQVQDLHAQLDELGVRNDIFVPHREEAVLTHGFMAKPTKWTTEYHKRKTAFLDEVLKCGH